MSLLSPESSFSQDVDVDVKYQEMELREHILLRPDSYVGGVDMIEMMEWVPEQVGSDINLANIQKFVHTKLNYCPAALKILDEILINARDAKIRDKGVTFIKIDINRVEKSITVCNNATHGIPIVQLKKSGLYVPESTFGKLLTGENFKDYEGKITGGRNGYGATCANIYSTKFIVDCSDTTTRQRFQQTFSNNMSEKTIPLITKYSKKEAYVKIKYYPDLDKLGGTNEIDDDFYKLAIRRVYDLAACTSDSVKIYINGKMLKIRTFERYVDLFLGSIKDCKRVFIKLKNQISEKDLDGLCLGNQEERKKKGQKGSDAAFVFKDVHPTEIEWDIAIGLSNGSFGHTAYVNGVHTPDGGEHVNYIRNKIVRQISNYIKNVKKKTVGSTDYIKNNLWIFVNATVINPAFSSQTKRELTTKSNKFFYKCKFPPEFIEEFERKCKITSRVLRVSEAIELEKLEENGNTKKKRKVRLPKLDEAKWAGGPKSSQCTLILTEGDSAKTLASSGLNVIGTEKYGIFPLRGKPLTLGKATVKQLLDNKEYNNIKKILGLFEGMTIDDIGKLRYGSIMLMSDQDYDGFHIKLIIMEWFKSRFPDLLLKYPHFIKCFITPIVSATPKNLNDKKLMFFSLKDYEDWKLNNPQVYTKYSIKYLKGLGTSTPEDAVSYFENVDKHFKEYYSHDDVKTLEAFDVAFVKDKILDRKQWLRDYDESDVLDYSQPKFTYCDGINKELKHYSTCSYRRAIPRLCDGLKDVQRKVLWTMIKKGIKTDKKVAQIKGAVSETADYHHGENAISACIVKMAQNYPGSNNYNILHPSGQFGSRRLNGTDASADRYIFTKLTGGTEMLFDSRDNKLLEYETDDYEKYIEPTQYVTILPLVLINGAQGTGTGFSTTVPSFNPLDIIAGLENLMEQISIDSTLDDIKSVNIVHLKPWFREFKGSIERNLDDTHYVSVGKWERVNPTKIKITELPLGPKCKSFVAYKEWLEKRLIDNQTKNDKQTANKRKRITSSKKVTNKTHFIKNIDTSITDNKCEYIVEFQDEVTLSNFIRQSGKLKDYAFERTMQLTVDIHYTNMILFDEYGKLKKFNSPEEILLHFYKIRLDLYHKRKKLLIEDYQIEVDRISEKVRFLEMIISETIKILKQSKVKVIEQLEQNHFKTFSPWIDPQDDKRYKYLLSIPINSVTTDKIEKFRKEKEKCLAHLQQIKNTHPKDMWKKDLNNIKQEIIKQNKSVHDRENYKGKEQKTKTKRKRKTQKHKIDI